MAENSVKILFEVKGGDSVDVGSGAKIKEQLLGIAAKVSKELKLQINVDKDHFTAQLQELKKTMQRELGNVQINPSGGTNSSSDTKEQKVELKEIYAQLEKIYSLRVKIDKAKDGSIVDLKSSRELQEQERILQEQITAYGGINDEIKEYQKRLEDATKIDVQSSVVAENKLKDKAASLYVDNGFDEVIKREPKAKALVDDFKRSVDEAFNALGKGEHLSKEKVEELNAKFIDTHRKLKEIQRQTDTVGNSIKKAFSDKVIQRIAFVLMMMVIRALKQVYDNVVKIDAAMTQLKIVTQESAEDYERFADNVAASAKKIGSSITDLISATTVFARLGYSLDEAEVLAEKTTAYSKVAAVDINDATNSITAIVKGFNVEASQLESVIDKLIYVGNHYAISSSEIGEAMNNAASALSSNGNTLEEAIGILTAANVTLQNVSKSSTGVRTIAARISASTAELIELGEDAGDVLATADLDAKMRAFGVAIVDTNGELRSTYDILSDVAKQWGTLDSVQRASIRDMLAGTRQQNVFDSIMQNWGDAKKVVESSSKSVGTYQNAVEQYANSIEGKLNSLKAAWEDFSASILNSSIVKFLISVLEGIVKVLTFGDGFLVKGALITAMVVGITSVLAKLSVGVSALAHKIRLLQAVSTKGLSSTQAFFAILQRSLKDFTKTLKENAPLIIIGTIITLMSTLQGKAKGFAEVIGGVVSFVVAAIVIGLKTVDAAAKAFETSNFIGWIMLAITAIISLVKGIFDLIESFNPSFESLKETAKDSIDIWKKAEDELKNVKEKLEEIEAKIEEINNQDGISLIDKNELNYLEQEKANLQALQDTKESEAKRAKQKAAQDTASALGKYNDTHTVSDAPWWEWLLIGPWAFIHQGIAWGSDTQEEKFNKILKDYQNASEEDKDFITSTIKEYSELLSEFNFGDDESLDPYLHQYYSILDRYNMQTGNAATTWNRVLADTRFSSEVEKLQQLANSQAVSMESIAAAAPNFINYLKEIGFYVDNDTASSNALVESIKNLRERLQSKARISFTDDMEIMQDKFDSFSNALKDIKNTGVVSMDNISKILDASAEGYPTLLKKYFNFIEGVGYTLRDDLKDKSMSEILKLMAEDELVQYANEVAAAEKVLSGMTADNEDYAMAVSNLSVAQDNLNTKTAEWATILREQAIEDETDRLEKLQEELEDQLDAYKDLIDIRKDLLKTYQQELDYQKQLAQKQQKVADLQTQLNLARLDNSASGQARARELQKQLETAKEELDDFTLDKAIEVITDKIDNQYDAYKQFIDEEIDKINKTIKDLGDTLRVLLNPTPNSSGESSEPIQQAVSKTRWTSYQDAVDAGFANIAGASASERGRVKNWVNPETGNKYQSYQEYLDVMYKKYMGKTPVYHSGGLVGGIALKSSEEFAKLLKGEFVSTPKQMDNFMKNTLPAIANAGGATFEYNSPLISIKCDSITEEAMPKLQEIVNEAVKQIGKQMEGALGRTGYKKKY